MCEVGQEKDGNGIWKWVLPYAEPCDCTSVKLGGMITKTPIRPFKPLYVSKPLVSNDVARIRQHYGLQCIGKTKTKPSHGVFYTNAFVCKALWYRTFEKLDCSLI